METGSADQMFTLARYREWLNRQSSFAKPQELESTQEYHRAAVPAPSLMKKKSKPVMEDGVLDLDGVEEDPASILARYRKKR